MLLSKCLIKFQMDLNKKYFLDIYCLKDLWDRISKC